MDNLLPKNEYKEVEGRYYADPNVALNESNQFIDNLRNIQNQQNQEIAQQTYNLGTDIESVRGGLGTNTTNDLSYFTSRYQVPQTTSVVANLRAAAQAAALNQVLSDEQEMWKNRYQNAYRNYQKRQYNRANSGTGGTGGTGDNGDDGGPNVEVTKEGGLQQTIRSNGHGTTTIGNFSTDTKTGEPGYDVYDSETGQRLYSYTGEGKTSSDNMFSGIGDWAVNTAIPLTIKTINDAIPWITPFKIATGL